MRSGKAITRRAFGLLAAAPLVVLQQKAVSAQNLPPCSDSTRSGNFNIYAEIYDDGTSHRTVTYASSRLRSGNAVGYVDVTPLCFTEKFTRTQGGQNSSDEMYLRLETDTGNDGGVPIAADSESVFYEIYNGGQRIFTTELELDDHYPTLANDLGLARQMWSGDSVVRLTIGSTYYDWTIRAQEFGEASTAALFMRSRLEYDSLHGTCKPGSSVPCLLTTVACRRLGLDDDCFELRTVRRLRDRWLVNQPFGAEALSWYRDNSRAILAAIPDNLAARLFARFYLLRLVPAVIAERLGLHCLAFTWLKQGVEKLHARYVQHRLQTS